MTRRHWQALGLGLILWACCAALAAQDRVPLASLEGFVRQVIGWREYGLSAYRATPELQDANHFALTRRLQPWWYPGRGIPDDLPIIGGLDDLIVLVLAVELFFDGAPKALLHEKLDELGIDRLAFEQDMAQVRRLTPGPVRRTIRRVPVLAADAVVHATFGEHDNDGNGDDGDSQQDTSSSNEEDEAEDFESELVSIASGPELATESACNSREARAGGPDSRK